MADQPESTTPDRARQVRGAVADLLAIAGTASIGTGLWWEWPALALVVVGGLCLAAGVLMGRAAR